MASFEIIMKKPTAKFQMLKIAWNDCHRLLQRNEIKDLEMHTKIFKERLKELKNVKSKAYVREGWQANMKLNYKKMMCQ